jgi:hypothetical protein
MLTCSKCGLEKDESEFNKRPSRPRGYTSHCKACTKEYMTTHSENYRELRRKKKERYKQQLIETPNLITRKVCTKCGIEQGITEFYKASNKEDGLTCHCKTCQKKYRDENADHYKEIKAKYYFDHKDEQSERAKIYRKENDAEIKARWKKMYAQKREILIARSLAWDKTHKKEVRERRAKHYKENREEILKRYMEYCKSPRGRATQARSRHKRYWRENETVATLTSDQWQKIIDSQNNKCAMCGKRFTKTRFPTRDHIIPVSLNGGLTFENVQALCRNCNSKKQADLDYSKIITWTYASG